MATLAGTVDLCQSVRPGHRSEAVSVDHQRPIIPVAESTNPSRIDQERYAILQTSGNDYRFPRSPVPAAPKDVAGIFLRFCGEAVPLDFGAASFGLVRVSESAPGDNSTSPGPVFFDSGSAPFYSGRWDRADPSHRVARPDPTSPLPPADFSYLAGQSSLGARRGEVFGLAKHPLRTTFLVGCP